MPTIAETPGVGTILGVPTGKFAGFIPLSPQAGRTFDTRHTLYPLTGQITDQVALIAGGIETPFSNGRVWLLRLADGFKAWEGWSDAAGHYTATGLELGVEYVAVGIDAFRNQKATGAGPVTATLAAP